MVFELLVTNHILNFRHPSNALLELIKLNEVGWIRTNDGHPTDLQSAALTTQPPLPMTNFTIAQLGRLHEYLH